MILTEPLSKPGKYLITQTRKPLTAREVIKNNYRATNGKNMTAPWMLVPLGNGMLPEITFANQKLCKKGAVSLFLYGVGLMNLEKTIFIPICIMVQNI